MPPITLVAIVLVAVAAVLPFRPSAAGQESGPPESAARRRGDLGLALLLLGVLSLPLWPAVVQGALGPTPCYANPDDAYLIAIARGQQLRFPPPDLLWNGEVNRYHQGAALATEGLARLAGSSLESAFYGTLPLLARLLFVAAAFVLFGALRPCWSRRERILAVAVSCGLYFVDPIALAWNVRNVVVTHSVDWQTALEGVPVAGPVELSASQPSPRGAPMADVFVLSAVAGTGTATALAPGAALAAAYLTKGQTGLPAFVGFATASVVAIGLLRSGTGFRVSLVAVPLLGLVGLLGPAASGTVVTLGAGANIRALGRIGAPYAARLGLGDVGAHALGLVLASSRWCLPVAVALFFSSVVWRSGDAGARRQLLFTVLPAAACLGFATTVVIRPGPAMTERFVATHSAVREGLWLPFDDYLERMFTDVSASAPNSAAVLLVGLLAAGGLVELDRRTAGRRFRPITVTALGAAVALFVANEAWRSGPGRTQETAKAKEIDPAAIEALRAIPVRGSVVFTNELAYDAEKAPHLAFMNAWMPALLGHQFWANDFMYDLHYANVADRYGKARRFWNEPLSPWHAEFLAREGIGWIVERKGMGGPRLEEWEAVTVVLDNARYRVARVKGAAGGR